jgi:periplasmic divalent cation tolerance protein
MPADPTPILFVYTTVAREEDARRLAEELIASGLAACVNIGAPITSLFRWESSQGGDREGHGEVSAERPASAAAVQSEREIPLVIKTTRAAYTALERRINEIHPYELPEIVAVPVDRGLPAFLAWIEEAVSAS